MAKRTNPLDTDAAKPVDSTEFDKARSEWKADKDRIVKDELPKVDKAIQSINDLSNFANGMVDLVGMILPIITRVTPAEGTAHVSAMQTALTDLKALACKLTGSCGG